MRILDSSDGPGSDSASANASVAASCGVEGLKDSCGSGVEARVEAELLFDAGCEEEASAAVLVLAATVMREDVVEGRTVAEVHDLVNSAVGRGDVVLEGRGVDVEARALSSAAKSGSEPGIDGA